MSEVTKPVEEVVAPTPAVEAPLAESTPAVEAVEPTTDVPATTESAKEDVAAPAKEEVKPVDEGTLGYKGPGLLKGFMFQKKFFWFGTEPVESKSLTSYLRGEKAQEAANKNVAWASSTGKGLLFFSKKATDKASPAGIFNLSEVSDVAEEGSVDFSFVTGGHKHTFQASTLAERDNWVAVLKTKIEEAKELATTVPETEEYKKAHSGLAPAVAAVAPKKSEEKKEEKAEAKEEKKEEKAEKKEEAKEAKEDKKSDLKAEKTRKSRSASRKRASIFGGFGIGKKDEKVEAPKEEAPVASTTTEEPIAAAPVEPVAVPETTETAAVVEPAATDAAPVTPGESRPTANKRASIFGNLKQQFSGTKEKKPAAEAAPVVPAKDAEPVSDNAPVIPAVEASEPLETSTASPATVPTETTELSASAEENKAAEPEKTKADKRKSSLPWLNKKEKSTTSDEETEKPKSPFAKLRATVKGKSTKTEKVSEKPAETVEESPATESAPAAAEPVVEKPEPVVPATTPQVTASA